MRKGVTCYIGLGGNLGDRRTFIEKAVEMLSQSPGLKVTAVSNIRNTKPLTAHGGDDYLNCVVQIQSQIEADELFRRTCVIEEALGRKREKKWQSRTIDIDLLLYGGEIIHNERLCIPHPQMHLRSFVLEGMCELSGDVVHPAIKKTMQQLAVRLNGGDYYLNPDLPQLISVAGVIGVGKTTLAKGLAQRLGCEIIAEAYDRNPYLAQVYSGRVELALKSQLFFLESRVEQLSGDCLRAGQIAVSDYVFEQELIYARRTLSSGQLAEYNSHNSLFKNKVAAPVVVIHIKDTVQACLERITRRARPYEKSLTAKELEWFCGEYEKLFEKWRQCPVIGIDAGRFNCLDAEDIAELAEEVKNYIWTSQKQQSR